ncbi:MAG: hypothetical protein ACSHX8_13900 [Opitutaceae bacterium]
MNDLTDQWIPYVPQIKDGMKELASTPLPEGYFALLFELCPADLNGMNITVYPIDQSQEVDDSWPLCNRMKESVPAEIELAPNVGATTGALKELESQVAQFLGSAWRSIEGWRTRAAYFSLRDGSVFVRLSDDVTVSGWDFENEGANQAG